MSINTEYVETAIHALRQGQSIILTDDPERENEGDLVCSAEKICADKMNFMIRHGSGIVCLALTPAQTQALNLPLMVPAPDNTSLRATPFTVSIDANPDKYDVTTGVSADDRARTVEVAMQAQVAATDLVRPGHIFPLQAHAQGLAARRGHTEGSVELMRLAGLKPAAVLCEVMMPDGDMARGTQLVDFAAHHKLCLLAIRDLEAYQIAQVRRRGRKALDLATWAAPGVGSAPSGV